MSQSHPNPRDGDGGCHPHLSCHPGCGEPGSFAHTRVCKKRCTLTQWGQGSAGIYFFFPAGISQRGERPASSPSVPAPAGKQPCKGWHRAPGGAGQDGVPKEKCEGGAAGVNPGGGHLAFPGHPSGTRGLFWELAGRRVTGRGALPGGGLSLRAAGSCSAPHPGRTRGFPPAAFRDPTPPSPRSPVLGGAAPHPIPSPSPGSAPAGRIRPRRGTKSKLPGTSSPWLGAVAGGRWRAPPGKTARRGSASSPSARSQPGGDGEIAAGPPRGANRRREGRGRALTVCALGRPLRKAPPPS